jgi:hypothetical protein
MSGESDQRSTLNFHVLRRVKRRRRELHESISRLMQPARLQFAISHFKLLIYMEIERWQ